MTNDESPSREALIQALEQHFPGATPMSTDDLRAWVYRGQTVTEQVTRARWLAQACYAVTGDIVFYHWKNHIGARYGIDGPDYISAAPAGFQGPNEYTHGS